MKTIVLLVSVCLTAAGQHFDVASVRVSPPGTLHSHSKGGPGTGDPRQFRWEGATLMELLRSAYDVQQQQVLGPKWLEEDRFDIAATVPAGSSKQDLRLMLLNLMEERFGLSAHRETRVLPVYAMLVAKDGPKFKVTQKDPPPDSASDADQKPVTSVGLGPDGYLAMPKGYRGTMVGMVVAGKYFTRFKGESMAEFAKFLTEQSDRLVIDLTELKDTYDFAATWQLDPESPLLAGLRAPPPSPMLADPSPTMFQALPSQLGLKLEPRKMPEEVVIVDRMERMPTEN
jgi:uncharacterized protein (TIGR03435 family)